MVMSNSDNQMALLIVLDKSPSVPYAGRYWEGGGGAIIQIFVFYPMTLLFDLDLVLL